ncbi:hypothetical protein T484DRAFT_1803158, partial [Baffinella frigidus]
VTPPKARHMAKHATIDDLRKWELLRGGQYNVEAVIYGGKSAVDFEDGFSRAGSDDTGKRSSNSRGSRETRLSRLDKFLFAGPLQEKMRCASREMRLSRLDKFLFAAPPHDKFAVRSSLVFSDSTYFDAESSPAKSEKALPRPTLVPVRDPRTGIIEMRPVPSSFPLEDPETAQLALGERHRDIWSTPFRLPKPEGKKATGARARLKEEQQQQQNLQTLLLQQGQMKKNQTGAWRASGKSRCLP